MIKTYFLTFMLALFFIFNKSSAADFKSFSWSSNNNTPGQTATYTFEYVLATAISGSNPLNSPFYCSFPSGFSYATGTTPTLSINGVNKAINAPEVVSGKTIRIFLQNNTGIAVDSRIIVTVQIVNNSNAGSYNWGFIKTADNGGNTIDQAANLTPITLATLSTNSFTEKALFSFSPNPASEFIDIKSELPIHFDIINQLGQNVKSYNNNHTNNNRLDLQNLNKGIYFINGRYNGNVFSRKLIIQ